MKWFKHDTTASQDAKIRKLIIKHGAVGYAVYFHCLELIAGDIEANKITFELEHDSEIIADNLKITGSGSESGCDIVNKIMSYIIELGLFESSNNKISCLQMAKRLDASMTSNPKFRELIKKSHEGVMIPSCKNRIDKNRIEENRLDNINIEKPKKQKVLKNKYGEYKKVLLTKEEYDRLLNDWGLEELNRMIKILDEGIEMKGNTYKYTNHNLALRKWKGNGISSKPHELTSIL